jgi:hypothetical protein
MADLARAARARDDAYRGRRAAFSPDIWMRLTGASSPKRLAQGVTAASSRLADDSGQLERAGRRAPTRRNSLLASLLTKSHPSSQAKTHPDSRTRS